MEFKVSIKPNNDIPAFAGYLSGTVREPEIRVVLNIEAMVNCAAEKENDISFQELFTVSLAHELLHAVQDLYRKSFDEEEVERVLDEASKSFYS